MLAILVLAIGLEGVDRALLERAMESLKPPRGPSPYSALLSGPLLPVPPAPPPPPPPSDADLFP